MTVWDEAARLEPAAFKRFLRASGWQEIESQTDRSTRFVRETTEGTVEIDIPNSSGFADYPRRLREALEILVLVDKSSPGDLVVALAQPNADILTFRFADVLFTDGTIPIDDALRIRQARRQLLLSAAHSVVEPLPHYPRLSRHDPIELLASCRELPPRQGSYVTSVLIPVSPAVGQIDLQPFARRVTELLANALCRAEDVLEAGDDEALLHEPRTGFSSNFLTALANLAPPGRRGTLEVRFSWAPGRPRPNVARDRVRLGQTVFSPLEEAARVLRETSAVPGYELEGYVARLERQVADDTSKPGTVVLATLIEDRPGTSKVHITLDPDTYQQAVEAHASASRVRVTGTLTRMGKKLLLQNAGGFTVLVEDAE